MVTRLSFCLCRLHKILQKVLADMKVYDSDTILATACRSSWSLHQIENYDAFCCKPPWPDPFNVCVGVQRPNILEDQSDTTAEVESHTRLTTLNSMSTENGSNKKIHGLRQGARRYSQTVRIRNGSRRAYTMGRLRTPLSGRHYHYSISFLDIVVAYWYSNHYTPRLSLKVQILKVHEWVYQKQGKWKLAQVKGK